MKVARVRALHAFHIRGGACPAFFQHSNPMTGRHPRQGSIGSDFDSLSILRRTLIAPLNDITGDFLPDALPNAPYYRGRVSAKTYSASRMPVRLWLSPRQLPQDRRGGPMCWRVCPAQLVQLPAAEVFAAFRDWVSHALSPGRSRLVGTVNASTHARSGGCPSVKKSRVCVSRSLISIEGS